jgi:hypothetical protein
LHTHTIRLVGIGSSRLRWSGGVGAVGMLGLCGHTVRGQYRGHNARGVDRAGL